MSDTSKGASGHRRAFRDRAVNLDGVQYSAAVDGKVYLVTPRGHRRVKDQRVVNQVIAQAQCDRFDELQRAGKWPADRPRPVPPHRSGGGTHLPSDLDLALRETRSSS